MSRKSRLILLISIVSVMTVAFGLHYFIRGTAVATEAIAISSITVKDDVLRINGDTPYSALGHRGHRYWVEDGNLYLQLEYSLANRVDSSGNFDIVIYEDFSNVKNVYLQGKNFHDKKLIWSR